MVTESEVRLATLMMFVGAVGIAFVAYASIAGAEPTALTPFSATVLRPYFEFGFAGAIATWPVVFLLWGLPLFSKRPAIPWWSASLAGVVWCIALVWLASGLLEGIDHQGSSYVVVLAGVDLVVGVILISLYYRGRRTPTFAANYLFHWLFVAWLAWGSLPWLGEGL